MGVGNQSPHASFLDRFAIKQQQAFGMSDDDLPDGVLAYREYEIAAPDGGTASIAFTLGRADADTGTADFARQAEARAHGLVSVLHYPGAPRHPAIWLQTEAGLGISVADEDGDLSDDLRQIVARCLAMFFNDIAAIAPELAAIPLKADGRGDRALN